MAKCSRRRFLCLLGTGVAGAFLSRRGRAGAARPGARRPNIVWVWADNLANRDLGC